MKCLRCGYDNVEGATFCAKCAAKLDYDAPVENDSSRPAWNVFHGPKWSEPDFSADSVSEDDIPEDFISDGGFNPVNDPEERRARAESAAEKSRKAAEDAAAKKAAEEQRMFERRSSDANDDDPRLRIAEEQFEEESLNVKRIASESFDDEDEDDDLEDYDSRPSKRNGSLFGGFFKHKDNQRKSRSDYDEDEDDEEEDDFEDDYEQRPARRQSGGSIFSNKKFMSTAIKIAAVVAAVAVLALLIFGIVKIASSCSKSTNPATGSNKSPVVEANPNDDTTYFVSVYAKEGRVLIYETADGTRKEVTVPASGFVKFKVPVSSLMPTEPVDGTTYSATPKVYIKNDDGTETLIEGIEPIMLQIPTINITFDNADSIVSEDGIVEITGHIDLVATELTINGEAVDIGQDGSFSHTVTYEDTGDYTINAEAKLSGHQVYRHSFNVTVMKATPATPLVQLPWEYGDTSFSQRVRNNVESIEVQGRVPSGAKVKVALPDSQFGSASEPVVSEDGLFKFTVTMPKAGDYLVVITCTTESGQESSRELHVQRQPDYASYVRGALAMNYASFSYATGQGYKISGTVTEIIEDGDYILAKLTTADDKPLIIQYHNHYGSAGTITVGRTYQKIYGRPMGLNDDGIPQIYVWFVDD